MKNTEQDQTEAPTGTDHDAREWRTNTASHARAMQANQEKSGRYLTMREAGARAGKSAAWALDHLKLTPCAPNRIEIPEPGAERDPAHVTTLVREGDWIEFLDSFEVAPLDRGRTVRAGTVRRSVPLAKGLMSPSQRKRLERAAAGRAN